MIIPTVMVSNLQVSLPKLLKNFITLKKALYYLFLASQVTTQKFGK